MTGRVEDEWALAKLGHEFAAAVDDGSVEQAAALFTADGVFEVMGVEHTGHAAIAAYVDKARRAGMTGPRSGARHLVTNVLVTVDSADAAHGRSEFVLMTPGDAGPYVRVAGGYRDRYRRVDGAWLIAHRTVVSYAPAED